MGLGTSGTVTVQSLFLLSYMNAVVSVSTSVGAAKGRPNPGHVTPGVLM